MDWERIRTVGFDLDGTLYDELDFIRQVYRPIARHLAGVCRAEEGEIHSRMLARWIEKGSSYNRIFDEVLTHHRVEPSEREAAIEECVRVFRAFRPRLTLPAASAEFLDAVSKRAGLFLVTDGQPQLQKAKIEALGLSRWFASSNIGLTGALGARGSKPSTAILASLEVFRDHASPERVVFFGDRACDRGFAENAGFRFVEVACHRPAGREE